MVNTIPVAPASLQAMFVAFKAGGDRLTLHTADPAGNVNTARAPGNTPVTTTWPAGANGSGTGSVCPCAVTAAANVTHVMLSHSTGTHVATYELPTAAAFSYPGTLNVTPTLTVAAAP